MSSVPDVQLSTMRPIADAQRVIEVGGARASIGVPAIPCSVLLPLLRPGPAALRRISRWGEVGLAHHPAERHQHVELVAVEAGLQGRGSAAS